jgi:hypothetical protein
MRNYHDTWTLRRVEGGWHNRRGRSVCIDTQVGALISWYDANTPVPVVQYGKIEAMSIDHKKARIRRMKIAEWESKRRNPSSVESVFAGQLSEVAE